MRKEDKEVQYRPDLADKLEACMNTAIKLYEADIKGVYFYLMSFTTEKGVHDELLLKASECFKPNVPFGEERYYEYYQKEIASKYGKDMAEITRASAARLVFGMYKDLIEHSFDEIDTDNLSKQEKYMVEYFRTVVLSPTRNPNIQIKEGHHKCYYDELYGAFSTRALEFERDLKSSIEFIKAKCQVTLDIFRTPDKEVDEEEQTDVEYVKTNMGYIPLKDYYDIQARQMGFDGYEDLREQGYSIDKPETTMLPEEYNEDDKDLDLLQ